MIVKNGTPDVTTYFVLRDSTNHAPKTDVTVTDIDLYYVEELTAISTKADASALAAADSAHADNSAFHVGQGLYRIDWPDAAFDKGIGKKVILLVVCTGVDTTFLEVELSPAVNVGAISEDATAADNLETACDGGTYNVGGGSIVAASVTGAVGSVTGNVGGNVVGSVASVTGAVGSVTGAVASVTGAVGSVTGNVGGNVAGSVGSVTGAVGSVTGAVTVGTNNDKTGYALSVAGVAAIWDALVTGITTAGSIGKRLVDYITGDIFARLGAPAGASVSADVAAVKTDTAAIKLKTDNLPASPAAVGDAMTLTVAYDAAKTASTQASVDVIDGIVDTIVARIIGTLAAGTHNAQSGDAYARLGAPAGASVSADVAAVKVDTAATLADTGTDGVVLSAATCAKIADIAFRRTMTNIQNSADGDALSLESLFGLLCREMVQAALVGATITIKKPDGNTLGTQTVTTDAAAEPIVSIT